MYLQWTRHSRARAKERFGVEDPALINPLMLSNWTRHERWWEMDDRGRYDKKNRMRGAVLNHVVPLVWEGQPIFGVLRRCDLDPNRYWVISVLTHSQYLNNRKNMWKRRRKALRRATADPVRHYPFKGLRLEGDDDDRPDRK
jgi:hypothetical protein